MDKMVSIIIPVYNVQDYICACLDSVIMQTYTNIEIIVIDDGSIDKSYEIAYSYKNKDERIRLYHKENGGLSSARNLGIELARGGYILFLDGDDYIEQNAIEALMKGFKADNSIDISVGSADYVYPDGLERKSNVDSYKLFDGVIPGLEVFHFYYVENKSIFLSACFKVYKKRLFENLKFPLGKLHEDAYVFPIIYINCNKVNCCDEILFHYVQRSSSITNIKVTDCAILSEINYRKFLQLFFYKHSNLGYNFYASVAYCDSLVGYGRYAEDDGLYLKLERKFRMFYKNMDKTKLTIRKKIKFGIAYICGFRIFKAFRR